MALKDWKKGDKFEYVDANNYNYGTVYKILKIQENKQNYKNSDIFAKALSPKKYKRNYNKIHMKFWVLDDYEQYVRRVK